MKTYRSNTKKMIAAIIFLFIIASAFYCFYDNLIGFLKTSWLMTIGEVREPCTPEDRFRYLEQHPEEIRVAMIGNWDQLRRLGRPRQQVILKAIADLNRAGGINGRRLIAEWMDTEGSADALLEIVGKIAHDPSYYAVFGPNTSGQVLVMKPLLQTFRLMTIAPSVSNVHVTGKGDYPCIFLPNASDIQCVQAIVDWAKAEKLDKFILINENQTFCMGYARQVERMFYEQKVEICGRCYFMPGKNVRFFEDELQNYDDYFDFQNILLINYTTDERFYYDFIQRMLKNKTGKFYFYSIPKGYFTDEQLKRMYTLVYSSEEQMNKLNALFADIPNALTDSFSLSAYQSIFIFADACRQAESLRQEVVLNVLQTRPMATPFGVFRFNLDRFTHNPTCRVISLFELQQLHNSIHSDEKKSKTDK